MITEEASLICRVFEVLSVFVITGGISETVCKESSCNGVPVVPLTSEVCAVN